MGGTLHFTLRRQPQYFTVSEASRFIRAQHIFIGVLSTCRKPLDCWDMGSKGGVSVNVPGARFPADPARPQTGEPISLHHRRSKLCSRHFRRQSADKGDRPGDKETGGERQTLPGLGAGAGGSPRFRSPAGNEAVGNGGPPGGEPGTAF